ncbi:MAG: DUF4040 domain-containing protein [Actinobacteria bacterium]|nr:DUF4040 domain-containing protein [Actinomycetota bacterium]
MYEPNIILFSFLIIAALAVAYTKDLIVATIIFSVYSLVMAIVWQRLSAPDLALTEAIVGTGVTTIIFIVTISKTSRREE